MISPFSGEKAVEKVKRITVNFRGEEFVVDRHYYECPKTGNTFSDARVDDMFMYNLYNQYRKRHNIPTPEELKKFRTHFGAAANSFFKIAGVSAKEYADYESGEVLPFKKLGQRLAYIIKNTPGSPFYEV